MRKEEERVGGRKGQEWCEEGGRESGREGRDSFD